MKKYSILLFFHFILLQVMAQKPDATLKIVQPDKNLLNVSTRHQYIIGSVCKECSLEINGIPQKLYTTGAFVYETDLTDSAETIVLISKLGKKKNEKRITFQYTPPQTPKPVKTLAIERFQIFPAGDLLLKSGDEIAFRVKALTGCKLMVENMTTLTEMPLSETQGMPGIYQGKYIISELDTLNGESLTVTATAPDGQQVSLASDAKITLMNDTISDMVITKGRLAHLLYGLGDDRLGGAKMSYIDSMIPLRVVGKVDSDYKVSIAPGRTAYIPDDRVRPMPAGTLPPGSLTGKIKVYGDSSYDYVSLQLFSKLPYQSNLLSDPSLIVVDVFGATNNTNWIDQIGTAEEVRKVGYEQIADGVYRLNIFLNHTQHWGHKIYYNNNNLVIRVKRQPAELSWNRLTIAVDAGHGGTNTGAIGATGVFEKELTLQISMKVKKLLEDKGVKVITTREKEMLFDNKERILLYRDKEPDLLVSIHLNSSGDPFGATGTSTFYRYEGFRNLSQKIYKRMLDLGLNPYGNNGSFNFMLNSATEYPNALVECLFLSNPDEEAKVLDENFQQQMAEQIVAGIGDFLESCKN